MEAQYQLLRFMVRREQPLASAGLALAADAPELPAPASLPADRVLDTLYLMQLLIQRPINAPRHTMSAIPKIAPA